MKNLIAVISLGIAISLLFSCRQENPYANLPGHYHSHAKWNGNDIHIKLKPDSVFTFVAYSDRGVTFCSAGTWSMQDSFLRLVAYDTTKKLSIEKDFPELKELNNVVSMQIDGKFIVRGDKIFNMDASGNADKEQYYDKENW